MSHSSEHKILGCVRQQKCNQNFRELYCRTYEPQHEISDNVVYVTSKGSDQPEHMHSLIRAFASRYECLATD